ncbi:MAG: hypothetical protein AAFX93_01615 [Verrucomicrobiota bacterium]
MKNLHTPLLSRLTALVILPSLAITSYAQETFDLPADWSYPLDSADVSTPGFLGSLRQARQDTNILPTISTANAHLLDLINDPLTDLPYENTAVNTDNPDVGSIWLGDIPLNPDGSFVVDGPLNFHSLADGSRGSEGNFDSSNGNPDKAFPGLPGASVAGGNLYTNGKNVSAEFLGFIELDAGENIIGIRHEDGMEIAFHPNDARDIFRSPAITFGTNGPVAERTVTVDAAVGGLYSMRVLISKWDGDTVLELYQVKDGQPQLINAPIVSIPDLSIGTTGNQYTLSWQGGGTLKENDDLNEIFTDSLDQSNPQTRTISTGARRFFIVEAATGAVENPVYQELTVATRPYITKVTPGSGDTGVATSSTVSVRLRNPSGSYVMRINDVVVSTTETVDGDETVISSDSQSFAPGSNVTVEFEYGTAVASWSFFTEAANARKALLFTNVFTSEDQIGDGDKWIRTRLASQFGMDVVLFHHDTPLATIQPELADTDLIFISSTVFGGNMSAVGSSLAATDVPVIVVEQALSDEFGLEDGVAGNANSFQQSLTVSVVEAHPAVGGLFGDVTVLTANEQHHYASTPADATLLVELPGGLDVLVVSEAGGVATARRAFFGVFGNEGTTKITEDGITLFDAVVSWALGDS